MSAKLVKNEIAQAVDIIAIVQSSLFISLLRDLEKEKIERENRREKKYGAGQ